MISSYNPQTASFLAGLQAIQVRAQKAQQQLTTGLKINNISDSPDQIPNLLQSKASIAHNDQVTLNLGRVKSETDTAESALNNAVLVLQQAQTLAAQGNTDTINAGTRANIAQQMGSLLQNLVSISATSVEGRYIFSGDQDQQAPYTIDLTQTSPISGYAGSASTRQIEAPDGTLFAVSNTAQDIFDSSDAKTNVFQAVNNARVALLNNDSAGLNAAMAQMGTAAAYLNNQLAFYGMTQDKVASATNDAANLDTSLKTELSGIQDADMTQAITDLTQAQTQEQDALASEASLPRKTLFDYLG
jgi:flagellar hook-associated protein 3 FlgL